MELVDQHLHPFTHLDLGQQDTDGAVGIDEEVGTQSARPPVPAAGGVDADAVSLHFWLARPSCQPSAAPLINLFLIADHCELGDCRFHGRHDEARRSRKPDRREMVAAA
jgi:hypothetical protein